MSPYFEQKILAASPVELVCLLYKHAIHCIRDAREHLRCKRILERSQAITTAWNILAELSASLDNEACPEVAQRLRALYAYMQERIIYANMAQKDEPLMEALGLLATLEEAWDTIHRQQMAAIEAPPLWHATPAEVAPLRFAISA